MTAVMKSMTCNSLCLIAVLMPMILPVSEASEEFQKENDVYVLTAETFDSFLEKFPTSLVEFYAPWCGHCKQLAPEYEKVAETLKSKLPSVALAKVDATVETTLKEKYQIQGFPTLYFWKDGQKLEYDGPRDSDGIVQWIQEKADPNFKPPPEAVVTLTTSGFSDFVESADLALVEFYAPWCGHCKKLAPEFEKAAQRLKLHDPPILLGKVDATVESDLAKDFGVSGYPTLKILRKGKRYDYNGPREAEGIVQYMKKQALPAAREFKNTEEIKKFFSKDDVSILGFFHSPEDSLFEAFKEAAEAAREEFKSIGYTFSPPVLSAFKKQPNVIAVYYPERFQSKYDSKHKLLSLAKATTEEVLQFWRDNSIPLIGQRTPENEGMRYSKRPLVVVYYNVDYSHDHRQATEFWRQKLLEVAKDFKDHFTFAIADEEKFQQEIESFGLGDSGSEINIGCFGKDGRKYPMVEDDFSQDTFREFLENLKKGKVKAHIKSQAAPKDDKGPVRTIVASNFDSVVLDETKDVLIEFYAPWCGHCKQLEPIYANLAKKLKTENNLVIAKFDATANDVPSNFAVEGFPTIYFAPAGKKLKPLKYEGARDLKSLEQYVKENAVVSFKKEEL